MGEWRCKWSGDGDKKSLALAQAALSELLPQVEAVAGLKSIQRVVCGGCLDFKVVVALPAAKFGDWEKASFAPEGKFLAKLNAISGVTEVETQTYTIMPAEPVAPITITPGVEFDTIAREWRCKWSADDNKKSLAGAQEALKAVMAEIKSVKGVKDVQRVVCGGCLDFKVVTALPADQFPEWEKVSFAPEGKFLDKLKSIKGISAVETQTYTLMPVKSSKHERAIDLKSAAVGVAVGFAAAMLLRALK